MTTSFVVEMTGWDRLIVAGLASDSLDFSRFIQQGHPPMLILDLADGLQALGLLQVHLQYEGGKSLIDFDRSRITWTVLAKAILRQEGNRSLTIDLGASAPPADFALGLTESKLAFLKRVDAMPTGTGFALGPDSGDVTSRDHLLNNGLVHFHPTHQQQHNICLTQLGAHVLTVHRDGQKTFLLELLWRS